MVDVITVQLINLTINMIHVKLREPGMKYNTVTHII